MPVAKTGGDINYNDITIGLANEDPPANPTKGRIFVNPGPPGRFWIGSATAWVQVPPELLQIIELQIVNMRLDALINGQALADSSESLRAALLNL